MNRNAVSIQAAFLKNMVLVVLAALFLWSAIWIHDEYSAFRSESDRLREAHLASCKAMLQQEVMQVVTYIERMKGRTEKRLKTDIRERVEDAFQMARHLCEQYWNVKPAEEIQAVVREALRPIRFNGGRGYYFVITLDGVAVLRPDAPEEEGRNMLLSENAATAAAVRHVIDLARTSGEGYYRYAWPKPYGNNDAHPKIAFVRRFEPFGWIIGAGEYLDDAVAEIQNDVLERLVTLRFGEEGYFFGSTYSGDPLFSNGKITRGGPRIWDLTDPEGVKIIQSQYQAAKAGGGFVRYVWPRIDFTKPSPKISYVAGIDDWQWIIGSGIYLDTVEQTIAEKEIRLREGLKNKLLKSALLFLALFVFILIWARWMSDRVRQSLLSLSVAFRRAAKESAPINPRELHFTEFRDVAEFANQMLSARKDAERSLLESEEKLRKAHKMEAVGTLAGGIAHEFNNVLGIILGNTELVMEDLTAAHPSRKNLAEIRKATLRARDVVRQLLNFSRMSHLNRQPIRLQEIVGNVTKMLRASVPRAIRIDADISETAGSIMGDAGQIQEALLHLGANAAQAMEDDGVLTFRLAETASDAGSWIVLTVSDTGHGIDPAIREKIFDPYFTTREQGKGTGMGLAVVHGIVETHGGTIMVESAPGKGTAVTIRFPAHREVESLETDSETPPSGNERILLVDDESAVAETEKQLLERLGYRVTAVLDPKEALKRFGAEPNAYDLVITDMAMPGMPGDALAGAVLAIRPDIPVILCTGFNEKIDSDRAMRLGVRCYMEKPLDKARLARAVRRALDRETTGPAHLSAC